MALNYITIIGAAVAGFFLGWAWYAILGKPWQQALGWSAEECKDQKMPLVPMALSFGTDLVMAFGLACLMLNLGVASIADGALLGLEIGLVFLLTTTATNNAFQKRKPILTFIDSGHWIAVLILQGALLAAFP